MKRRHRLMRRRGLSPVSARRLERLELRAAVVQAVHDRDRSCVGARKVPSVACWGVLDVHELWARGVAPGSELDVEACILLCRAHHEWTHHNPLDAHAAGLRKLSWEQRP